MFLCYLWKRRLGKRLERLLTKNLLKLDKYEIINNSIHFSFLENTNEVEEIIKS